MKTKISSKRRKGVLITLIIACSLLKIQTATCQNHKKNPPPASTKQVDINVKNECLNYVKGKTFAYPCNKNVMITEVLRFNNDSTGNYINSQLGGASPFAISISDTISGKTGDNIIHKYRIITLTYNDKKSFGIRKLMFWDDGNIRTEHGCELTTNFTKESWMGN